MSNNLSRCRRCKKILIDEEYESHVCTPKLNFRINKMEFDYFIITTDKETGGKIISIKTMDGTTYRFVQRKEQSTDKEPFRLSDESYQYMGKIQS